jgi:sphingolipid delta-4 desaturase
VFLLLTYIVGGTIAHTSHVLIHDYTHFIGDYPPNLLRFFAILNNVCIGIPTAMSFGKYHADHHNFLG